MDDEESAEKTEETEAKEEPKHHHPPKDEGAEDEDKSTPSLEPKSRNFLNWFKQHKKISIPASVAVFLLVFFAIPFTRYSALGLFLKQDFSVVVVDSQTGKPVSAAQVSLRGQTASTDGEGKAAVRVPVGGGKLTVTKNYYNTFSRNVVVTLSKPDELSVRLKATGRLVPVSVTNNISHQPVANALLSAGQSQAKTDDKGQATLVVPVGAEELKGTLSGDGYNKADITVKATTEEDKANKFGLTPTGKIYFLSNQSGKIDVISSDLDGKNRETVLAGTGKEKKGETSLLATRDWKYLALKSRRDGGDYDKLFLISTSDGKTVTMDEGEATFSLVGWEDHNFAYTVNREKVTIWTAKKQALKSFNAETKKLTTLDQTAAEGKANDYAYESYGDTTVINGKLLFVKGWNQDSYKSRLKGKSLTLNSISFGGGDKKVIKSFPVASNATYAYLEQRLTAYEQFHLYFYNGEEGSFYQFKDGQVTTLSNFESDDFYDLDTAATYLESPSKKKYFWNESRDGKLAFFAGDPQSKDPEQIMTLDGGYQVYGWFTDDYVLLSKDGSELFIAPSSGLGAGGELFKVTDYYKPIYNYYGYGGGYGGI